MNPRPRLSGLSRRQLLAGLAAAPVAALLPGCRPGPACDPPSVNGIDWVPDVVHPVAWGEEHLTPADGAPRTLSIYHPSHRFLPPRPMLRHCLAKWPVVLFLHGLRPEGVPETGYHRRWWRLPVSLARSGYVVVVPSHTANPQSEAAVAAALADIAFVRTTWSQAEWVDQRPISTVLAGHSFGAVLAARVAKANPAIAGALVSLGGGFLGFPEFLSGIGCPRFFMFNADINNENLDNLWDRLEGDRWAAFYDGGHFDYLPASSTGTEPRGDCTRIDGVAADLATLFVAANVQSLTQIPVSLVKPQVTLTPAQEALAIQHLLSEERIAGDRGCRVELKWVVGGAAGARSIGPGA